MNRQERRRLERTAAKSATKPTNGHEPGPRPPICAPGTHAYAELAGTLEGKVVAKAVFCTRCRRTFQQIMEESPDDLALYRAFLEREAAAAEHDHEPDPDGLPVEGCAGCARIQALAHSDPDNL